MVASARHRARHANITYNTQSRTHVTNNHLNNSSRYTLHTAVSVLQRSRFGEIEHIDFATIFKHSSLAEDVLAEMHPKSITASGGTEVDHHGFAAPFLTQFTVVFRRTLVNFGRSPVLMKARTGQTIFFALLCALIYRDIGTDEKSMQDRRGILFFVSIQNMFLPLLGSILTFPEEKLIMKSEVSSGYYSATAYALAKSMAETPFQVSFA